MDSQTQNFLTLLSTAIHQSESTQKLQLNNPVDWSYLSSQARKQNLLPIFVEAAQKYDTYRACSEYERDVQDAMVMVAFQMRRTGGFLDLYKAFLENGLSPIVVKGITLRKLYGHYEDYRLSGDEDIYIHPEEYDKVRKVMESMNYQCTQPDLTTRQLSRMQEVTFYNQTLDLNVEVHLNLIGKENKVRAYMNGLFEHAFDETVMMEIDGIPVRVMKPTLYFLFLVLHAFKHFQYNGVGIRQVLDILLFKEFYKNKICMSNIEEPLKKTHADLFLKDILWIGHQFFHLSEDNNGQKCCPEELLEDLMKSGVFGKFEKSDTLSTNIRTSMMGDISKKGNLQFLLYGAFPPYGQLIGSYPYLEEKPWLLPVAWIKRWMKFLKYTGKNMPSIIHETVKKSRHREDILKKYGV